MPLMYALLVLLYLAYAAVPVFLAIGWIQWARAAAGTSRLGVISLALSTASAALALWMVLYAKAVGRFGFYDRMLMAAYRWGFLLAFTALILALNAMRRGSPVRWPAVGSSFGMLLMWFIWASAE